jgi:predicted 3-demethylubiquinone-9 3-methyltransferase (glyoxalase superfamily)
MSTLTKGSLITPFLWFDQNAEEAVDFYVSIFPNSRLTDELRNTGDAPGPKGGVLTLTFELDGARFIALNGGPGQQFSESVSFVVNCETQEEIDHYWSKLLEGGGSPIACGWLKDKFGLRWQVTPTRIGELLRSSKAMQAMMQMTKFDIAELERAAAES